MEDRAGEQVEAGLLSERIGVHTDAWIVPGSDDELVLMPCPLRSDRTGRQTSDHSKNRQCRHEQAGQPLEVLAHHDLRAMMDGPNIEARHGSGGTFEFRSGRDLRDGGWIPPRNSS